MYQQKRHRHGLALELLKDAALSVAPGVWGAMDFEDRKKCVDEVMGKHREKLKAPKRPKAARSSKSFRKTAMLARMKRNVLTRNKKNDAAVALQRMVRNRKRRLRKDETRPEPARGTRTCRPGTRARLRVLPEHTTLHTKGGTATCGSRAGLEARRKIEAELRADRRQRYYHGDLGWALLRRQEDQLAAMRERPRARPRGAFETYSSKFRSRRLSSAETVHVSAAAAPRLGSTETVHVSAAASPRLGSAECQRLGLGGAATHLHGKCPLLGRSGAATWLHGMSTTRPRRRRDLAPRNIHATGWLPSGWFPRRRAPLRGAPRFQ